MLLDSHIHSTYSDGVYTPAELWERIVRRGLGGWALTDHDSMAGVEEAREIGRRHYPERLFIAGCEFSTHHPVVGEVHILAYFSGEYSPILPLLEQYRKSRIQRARAMVDLLRHEGYHLDWDDLAERYADKPIGRMHLARALVSAGYLSSPSQAFQGLLNNQGRCYVPREEIRTEEVIRTIQEAGGIPILAHPVFLAEHTSHAFLKQWIDDGLAGIEYRHPRVPEALSAFLAGEYRSLFLVSGSDFHDDSGDRDLGNYGIAMARWEYFLAHGGGKGRGENM